MLALLVATPARSAEVDFVCSPDDDGNGPIVGLPGLEVRCVVDAPITEGTWEATTWLFGDGTVLEGDAVAHTYAQVGQYTVSVELDGFVPFAPDSGAEEVDPGASKPGYVTVCGPPEPEFTYRYKGDLDYQMINTSAVAVHCLATSQWSVFEGRGTGGEPIATATTWDPRFTLPREGTYTVTLTQGGIAGTAAASLEIEAEIGLSGDFAAAPHASGCRTAHLGPLGTLPLVALLARRRRR